MNQKLLASLVSFLKSRAGVTIVIAICLTGILTIVPLFLIVSDGTRTENLISLLRREHGSIGSFDTKGAKAPSTGSVRQIGFWTPSQETADSVEKDTRAMLRPQDNWQRITEAKVDEFAERLATKFKGRMSGYRRYRTVGRGTTHTKVGWWWVVTVPMDLKTQELVQTYIDFWYKGWLDVRENLYVEETNYSVSYLGKGDDAHR